MRKALLTTGLAVIGMVSNAQNNSFIYLKDAHALEHAKLVNSIMANQQASMYQLHKPTKPTGGNKE